MVDKYNFQKKLFLILFGAFLGILQVKSQCALGTYTGVLAPSSGTNFVTTSGYSPGTYFALPVINGLSYAVSTCGSTIDTQITGWASSSISLLFYNDDNGPLCGGSNASVNNYVPNFTDMVAVQVSEYNCSPGGTSSIFLYIRQNDNLVITSSGAAMCSGQTRGLTAMPQAVASVPSSVYGNPGTFTGTGVSGTVFTAPTVTATTVFTITYTMGYVSKTQTIQVNPLPTVVVTAASLCAGNSATLVASGASTYTWSTGSVGGTLPISPATSTVYSVYGSSAAGCISSNTAVSNVTVSSNPTISVNSGAVCSGKNFTMVPSGAFTYTFSSGSAVVTPTANTSYSVTGTSSDGCIASNIAVSDVTVNTTPTVSVNSGSLCSGASFTMVPSGASTYTFSSGSAVVTPVGNTSYSITGTSAQGCVSSNTAVSNVTVHATPTLNVNSGSLCSGSNFTLVPTGASTYTFSSGSAVVAPTANTSYSVTGTSAQGCVSSNTAVSNVTVNATPTVAVNSGSLCSGSSFTLVPSGAFTYTFSSGSSVVAPTTSSSYSVTGTSAQGCVSSNTAISNVTVNTTPTVSVNSGSLCSGRVFTLIPSGASSYTFSSGSATVAPSGSTSYSVTGTSVQGCISSNTAVSNVTVNATPTINVNSGSLCSGSNFTLVPTGASTYTFSSGSAVVAPTANTSYSVTGTSAQGCVSSNTAISNVTVNTTPTVSVNSGSLCSGRVFTLVPSGASTYTYSSGSATVAPAGNTSYSVTGTSAQGCVSSNTAVSNVTVHATPTVAVNSGSLCSGASFILVPSGASTYTFSSGSATVAPSVNTSYSVTGTSSQGCVSSNTAISNLTVTSSPTVAVNSGSLCSGANFTLVPTGATTYTFSSGSAIVTPTVTSTYTVTGANAQGCVSSPAVSNVTVSSSPTISVNSGSLCSGRVFTLVPSGASTYTYSSGSATVAPSGNTAYSVTGTSAQGCVSSNTAVSNVTVYATPTVAVNSGSLCSGASFTLVPTGASTYTFSGGSAVVVPTTSTSYSVTGTSALGCVSSNTAIGNVTVTSAPTVAVNSGSLCSGASFTMVPSGASSYTFSSGSAVVTPTVTSTYTVTGTNAQGCVSPPAVSNVTVASTPTVAVNSGSLCLGASFTMVPSGASSYTFSSGSAVVTPTVTSTYTVTGANAQGCLSSPAVGNVTVFATPTLAVVGSHSYACTGITPTLTVSGAQTYTWSTSSTATAITVSPTASTLYSVTGASSQGCVSAPVVTSIVYVPQPTLSTQQNTAVCNGATLSLPAGNGNMTYNWSGGVTGGVPFTVTANASYSATATNTGNGCQQPNVSVVNVTAVAIPVVSLSVVAPVICYGATTAINATGAQQYSFSTGVTNGIGFAPGSTANYTVLGFNQQGNTFCFGASAVTGITVNPTPTITITKTSSVMCVGETATISLTGPTNYTWSTGSTASFVTISPTVVANVGFTVDFVSAQGCTNTAAVTQTVSACTGVAERVHGGRINLFPNPSQGLFTLEFDTEGRKQVQVFNSVGQMIFIRSVNTMREEFDLSELPKGIYYFSISEAGSTRYIKAITE